MKIKDQQPVFRKRSKAVGANVGNDGVEEESLSDKEILRAYRESLKDGTASDDKVLVSACLAGLSCRYDSGNCLNNDIQALLEEGKAVPVCPEQLGGLPTPRVPAEIVNGDGKDVLNGSSMVMNKGGEDVSVQFIRGADMTLKVAMDSQVKFAVLKSRSPSCGVGEIYDGMFSRTTRQGDGTAASKLREAGIPVFSDVEWERLG